MKETANFQVERSVNRQSVVYISLAWLFCLAHFWTDGKLCDDI
jgi:hypothetical protein